ncbi:retrotransposon protein, putative, ty1-copia subclass [Tanacetum coccineum]
MVRSMMSQTTLPKSFWDYALESAARILNMVPTKKVNKTPYEVWHGQAPKLSYLKVWGCEALVKRDTLTKPDKLELGAFNYHKEEDHEIDEPQIDINPIRRSTRTRRPTDRLCLYVDDEEHEYEVQIGESMKDNEVWELVDLPPDGKIVGHKWLFKKKTDIDGAVHTYKARLVAKGFTQTLGIDYEETFSLVADIRAIRILIAITAFYDYEIWQMNVKTAFLNGYLNEEKILKRYYMKNSKRGTIPMQEKLKFSKSQSASTPAEIQRMQNILYALAVGSIMYVVRCTRPDVVFAQNITSRFQQNPGDAHWTVVKNIMKYLRNTKDMFLVYGGDTKRELRVSCYTDAGYLTDADDMKSQTGYVFILNGGSVDWKSTKQSIFATSSTDVEYIAAFDSSKDAVMDSAIAITKDHGVTKGARHFRAKVHYLQETIKMGDVKIEKVDTDDNLDDPFTKALAFSKHSELTEKIGMIPASSLM